MTDAHRPSGAAGETASPRRALVLGGGGIRVAYQAGVIRALVDAGLTFSHVDGTSGGALNAAMLLSGLSPVEMCDRWRTFSTRRLASMAFFMDALKPSGASVRGTRAGIPEDVLLQLGIDVEKVKRAAGLAGTFNVANFATKRNEVVESGRLESDLLLGAISLPMILPAVRKDGGVYLDAAWIQGANCMEAVRRGADEIWLVWCLGNTPTYRDGLFNQYLHTMELTANNAVLSELERIAEINDRIEKGERVGGRRRPIVVHVVKPEYPLPLDSEVYFGNASTTSLMATGYRDAVRYLDNRDERGVALGPNATEMREPGLGLAFREVMSGPFAMAEMDPRAGARRGRDLAHTLSMHANIEIVDLDRFLEDPEHAGTITGEVEYAPLGDRMPSKCGRFNLFSPAERPLVKYMVYELGFEAGGEDYYLAGRKEVRNDPGLDVWRDTTTLYARLHRGRNVTGPVVGAGVLTIGVPELLQMLSTVTARNADSIAQRGEALAKFGAFFSHRLYEVYLRGNARRAAQAANAS